MFQIIYRNATINVRVNETAAKFKIERGVRRGDINSPKLFTNLLEYLLKELKDQSDLCGGKSSSSEAKLGWT